jgi:hypothetical protein
MIVNNGWILLYHCQYCDVPEFTDNYCYNIMPSFQQWWIVVQVCSCTERILAHKYVSVTCPLHKI